MFFLPEHARDIQPGRAGPTRVAHAAPAHNPVWRSLALGAGSVGGPAPPSVAEALRSPARRLDPDTRADMEAGFGRDLGHVRLHTGPRAEESARDVGARAYTVGGHIVFGPGAYAPATPEGRHLLSHEMAHAVQQQGAGSRPAGGLEVSRPGDPLEVAAESAADAVTSGGASTPGAAAAQSVARQPAGDAAGAAPQAAEDKAAGASSAVLPFKAKAPGEGGGWDSGAILSALKIDASSEAGKAVAAGPEQVWQLSHQIATQTAAEMKALADVDEYWAALLTASITCSAFCISLTYLTATHAQLAEFAPLSDAVSRRGAERKGHIISWSKQPRVPMGTAPAAAPQAAPQAAAPTDAAAKAAADEAAANKPPGAWAPAYGSRKTHTGLTVGEYQKAMGTGDFSKGQGVELLKDANLYGGTLRKAKTVTLEQLYRIFPDLKADVDADTTNTIKPKVDNYLANLNQAFRVMGINTVEAQATYLAHAYVESDQFRKFNETTKARYIDDPKQAQLDEGYLQEQYMEPTKEAREEAARTKTPPAPNPYRTTVNPLRANDPTQGWEQSFIGRGPLQVTHRAVYVQVIAFLDKRVQQAKQEKDWETARVAREAQDALQADPRNAADPRYAFLISAAFMQMAGGVRRSASLKGRKNLPDFTGKGPESTWMTGSHLESTDPIDKPKLKADAYKRAVEEFIKADASVP